MVSLIWKLNIEICPGSCIFVQLSARLHLKSTTKLTNLTSFVSLRHIKNNPCSSVSMQILQMSRASVYTHFPKSQLNIFVVSLETLGVKMKQINKYKCFCFNGLNLKEHNYEHRCSEPI